MGKAREYDPVTDFPKHWCGNCQLRIYFARHYEIHLDWKNCPYTCGYKKEMIELEKAEKGEQMNNIDANFIKNGTIEDWIVANEKTCSGEEQKRETAKEVLENMECILREMENHVRMISEAVYRGENYVEKGPALTNEPCATPPMVVMMRLQRDTAEHLLKEIIKIREALW